MAPTFVRTDLTTPLFEHPDTLAVVMRHTPLGVLPETDGAPLLGNAPAKDQPRCRCAQDSAVRHGPYHEWGRMQKGLS